MKQSEMNYAHPLALDTHPMGLFLFSLELHFQHILFSFFFLLQKMTVQNLLLQVSARLNTLLCVPFLRLMNVLWLGAVIFYNLVGWRVEVAL